MPVSVERVSQTLVELATSVGETLAITGCGAEVDGQRLPAELAQSVGDAPAHAGVVDGHGEIGVIAAAGADPSGRFCEGGAPEPLLPNQSAVGDPAEGGRVPSVTRDVDPERQTVGCAGRVRDRIERAIEDGERKESVRALGGKLGQHARAVQLTRLAPERSPLLDPSPTDQVRSNCEIVRRGRRGEVRGIEGADPKGPVRLGLLVEGVEEGAVWHRGVADHQQPGVARRQHAFNRAEDRIRDRARLVDDDEQSRRVKALHPFGLVGAQAQREPAAAQAQLGIEQRAA